MAKDAKGHGSEGRSGGQKQSWDAKRGSYAKGFAGAHGHGSESRGSGGKDLMSALQLAQLKTAYAGIKTVDPSQPAYSKLTALLSASSPERLTQLASAGIPFVSPLARNRLPPDPAAHQAGVEAARNVQRESLRGSIDSNPIDASGHDWREDRHLHNKAASE